MKPSMLMKPLNKSIQRARGRKNESKFPFPAQRQRPSEQCSSGSTLEWVLTEGHCAGDTSLCRLRKLFNQSFLIAVFVLLSLPSAEAQYNRMHKNYELPGQGYEELAKPARPPHSATKQPVFLLPNFAAEHAAGLEEERKSSAQTTGTYPFTNIKLLRHLDQAQLMSVMAFMSESLNVECSYCHNVQDFSSDELAAKEITRTMIQMVQGMTAAGSGMTCYTCHAGTAKVKTLPVDLSKHLPDGWKRYSENHSANQR